MSKASTVSGIFCTLSVVFVVFFGSFGSLSAQALGPEERAKLERELQQIEKQIQDQQRILDSKKGEGRTISRDISILDAKIKEAQLKIKKHNLAIDRLGKDITVKSKTIGTLEERISDGKESLADIIRKRNELDSYSVAEALLTKRNFADFFIDFDTLASLQGSLKEFLNDVKTAKGQNEHEKEVLDANRSKEIDTRVNVEKEQASIKANEAEKKRLLALNKQDQVSYQAIISDNQKKANEIKNRLFPLIASGPIKFEDAIAYAKAASAMTGVRPAFILAILKQETNLGANVGQCYLTDPVTGSGKGKNTGTPFTRVMKTDRDVAPFLDITKRLGRDPFTTVVSCPQSIGFGGAMGPSQFIASTWVMYEHRVAAVVGAKIGDPWIPRHAFTATALFLQDLGASKGGFSAEQEAAGRYYAGGGWATRGLGYAASVLAIAAGFQKDIDFLQDQ